MSHYDAKAEALKSEEMRQVAAQIDAYNQRYSRPEEWRIHSIAHLYNLPLEAYQVRYEDGYAQVFFRDEEGILKQADTWTYWAPEYERKTRKEETP